MQACNRMNIYTIPLYDTLGTFKTRDPYLKIVREDIEY